MILKIVPSSDPVLRQISKRVPKIDKKITEFIRDMKDTLRVQKEPEGVALAAPQVGKSLRIFVTNYKDFQKVVINPEIIKVENTVNKPKSTKKVKKQKKETEILEGCLSIPYYYGPLRRASRVTVKYMNEQGESVTETFEDFYAQIVMHEIDHLEGILFVDHLLKEKKPLYKVDGDEWEEVELIYK